MRPGRHPLKRAPSFQFLFSTLLFFMFLITAPLTPPLFAQETVWYISNGAGLALYPAPSRIVALRSDYCLGMSIISRSSLPQELLAYYQSPYTVDFRTLYEKGKPKRLQWVFRDDRGASRLTAVADIKDGSPSLTFIERYGESDLLVEERQFSEEEQITTVYFYEKGVLVRSETRVETLFTIKPEGADSAASDANDANDDPQGDAGSGQHDDAQTESGESAGAEEEPARPPATPDEPVEPQKEWRETSFWTDYYRYSRSHSLREVQRIVHAGAPQALTLSFPQLKPRPEFDRNFVHPHTTYNSTFLNETLSSDSVSEVAYTIDDRGRTLVESHYDETGALISEVKNNWVRDRLASVEWRSFDNEGAVLERRLAEYEYDAKDNRVMERNYVNGVLERTVRTEGRQEIEELHIDGKVVLRAIWEDGRKITEERVRGRQ
ncbi:MAG: hypothetical protein LBK73_02335 [Treponema sp.]|nr:hypothetical protein [Treponema sp.]